MAAKNAKQGTASRTAKARKPRAPLAKAVRKKAAAKNTRGQKAGVQDAYDGICETWDENRRRPFSPMPLFAGEFQKRFSMRVGTLSHARILDAGCGNARNAIWLSKKFPRAYISCCDLSAGMLHSASRNVVAACKAHSCAIRKADVENLDYPSASFDAVLCTAVLHHIPKSKGWVRALSEINRVLKHPGFAFVTVWSDPAAKAGTDRTVGFPTRQGNKVPRFYHFFTRRELEGAARKAGFEVADAFYEAGGKRTGMENKAKARNLCVVLQKQRVRPESPMGRSKGRLQ